MNLLEKWKNFVDKGKPFGALFTDLSKAFDCLDDELLTTKLNAYGVSLPGLRSIHTTHQTDDNYNCLKFVIIILDQKYYLAFCKRQFLFVVNDIDIANNADDSAPFIAENNIDNIIAALEQVSDALFSWIKNNSLKSHIDTGQVLVSTKKPVGIKIEDYTIDNSMCEKLLGVKIDVNIKFNNHIHDLFKKLVKR